MGKLADLEHKYRHGKDGRVMLTWDQCLAAVMREFECTLEEMIHQRPSRSAAAARDVLSYLAFFYSPLSASAIAERMGRTDHQTIILRKNKIRDRMKHVPEYRETMELFVREIQNDPAG